MPIVVVKMKEERVMRKIVILVCLFFIWSMSFSMEKDVIKSSVGDIEISFVGHASLIFEWNHKIIHIDPYGKLADYSKFSKADVIMITHHHQDHLDKTVIEMLKKENTDLVLSEISYNQIKIGRIIKNNERTTVEGILIESIPAYNMVHKRDNGVFYHPKGEGNGYIFTFGDKRILVAGDTENIPEISSLKNIDVAFLPMNVPFTMTPEMVADSAKAFKPKVLYPYHFGKTNTDKLIELMKDVSDVEIRIRKME